MMIRETQCRTGDAGGATGNAAEVRTESQIDVPGLIRPENPAAGCLEERDGLGGGVPEPIARAHADHSDLRSEHREHLGGHGASAAVMPDFEHVDVGERAACREPLQNVALGVPGQQNAAAVMLHQEDDTRGVLGGVVHRVPRPKHAHAHAPHREAVSRGGLASRDAHLCGLPREHTGLSGRRDQELAYAEHTRQGAGTSGVVIVRMGQHDPIKRPYPRAGECLTQCARRWTGVDQKYLRPVSHEDGISLAHIEHGHERPVGRAWSSQHDQQYEDRCGPHEARAPRLRARPPCPQCKSASAA